jgi:ferredoxin
MSVRTGTIRADRERCCGSGMCALRVPAVFDQDEEGTVVVLTADPPRELWDKVTAAVDGCPSGALSLTGP